MTTHKQFLQDRSAEAATRIIGSAQNVIQSEAVDEIAKVAVDFASGVAVAARTHTAAPFAEGYRRMVTEKMEENGFENLLAQHGAKKIDHNTTGTLTLEEALIELVERAYKRGYETAIGEVQDKIRGSR